MVICVETGAISGRSIPTYEEDRLAEEENRMADNPKDRQPQDAQRVNIDQNYELQYWSQKFGVSPEQLKRVVDRVGPMADDVKRAIAGLSA